MIGVFVSFSRIFLLRILIFKGLTALRLYKSFGVKWLKLLQSVRMHRVPPFGHRSYTAVLCIVSVKWCCLMNLCCGSWNVLTRPCIGSSCEILWLFGSVTYTELNFRIYPTYAQICFMRLVRGQETGEKRRNEEIWKLYFSPDFMSTLKSRMFKMDGARSTHVTHT
jgi:hypothetical protein